jgi:hypothetical protein
MLIFRNKPAQGHPPSKALSLKIELYFFPSKTSNERKKALSWSLPKGAKRSLRWCAGGGFGVGKGCKGS